MGWHSLSLGKMHPNIVDFLICLLRNLSLIRLESTIRACEKNYHGQSDLVNESITRVFVELIICHPVIGLGLTNSGLNWFGDIY